MLLQFGWVEVCQSSICLLIGPDIQNRTAPTAQKPCSSHTYWPCDSGCVLGFSLNWLNYLSVHAWAMGNVE